MSEDEKKEEISTPEPTTDIKMDDKKPDDDTKLDDNSKSVTPEISQEIVANMASRLRFFFSNANLRRDRFLRLIVTDSNSGGFAPVITLLKFNTIKQVSLEPLALVRAVQEDEKLKTLLKLNDDKTSIARIKPFTMDMMNKEVGVTLRVSGIPMSGNGEGADYVVTREAVENAFKEFGYVAMVRMLYNYKKGDNGNGSRTAIGRAFVEMETEEEMQNAAAAFCVPESDVKESDKETEKVETKEAQAETKEEQTETKEEPTETKEEPTETKEEPTETRTEKKEEPTETKTETKEEQPKRTLKLGGTEVRVKTMQQWFNQREVKKIARFGGSGRGGGRGGGRGDRGSGRGGGRGGERGGGRGYMEKRDQQNQGGERRDAKGLEKRARENEGKQNGDKIEFKLDWKKGCVISIKGLPDDCDREKIQATIIDVVGKDVKVRADYSRGQKDGAIRFEEPNEKIAELAAKINAGTAMVGGCKVGSATIIEGNDEEKYYKEYIAFRTKQFQTRAEESQHKRSRRR